MVSTGFRLALVSLVLLGTASVGTAQVSEVKGDATGIVASVDSRTGTVTLQDGRVVRVTPGTTVWQPVTIGSVMPGASVFVRNAEALDFRPATPSAVSQPYQMGTIGTVTPASVSALPRQATGVVLAERIYVVRRPQSP